MSFRAKQRVKHSHLFGDDPLNALGTPTEDDALFSTGQRASSRQGHQVDGNDPLSLAGTTPERSPSSASLHKRIGSSDSNKSGQGSLIGDTKLGGLSGNRPNALRIASSLLSTDDDDDELLFGAKKSERRRPPPPPPPPPRVSSDASSALSSPRSSFSDEKPPPSFDSRVPLPRPAPPLSPPSFSAKKEETLPDQPENLADANSRRSSSSFFSRFIKTKVPEDNPSSPVKSRPPPPPVPPRQPAKSISSAQPPLISSLQPSDQATATSMSTPTLQVSDTTSKTTSHMAQAKEQHEQEDGQEEEIEDEATRAFATVVTLRPSISTYTASHYDPEVLASLTNDTLGLLDRPSMTSSASTPVHYRSSFLESPSLKIPLVVDEASEEALNPWSAPSLFNHRQFTLSTSASSPMVKRPQQTQNGPETDTLSAFADLAATWNGRERTEVISIHQEPDDEFVTRVAAEQRDVGFAGIHDPQSDGRREVRNSQTNLGWHIAEDVDNPWR